jgi:lipoic acid synthetase
MIFPPNKSQEIESQENPKEEPARGRIGRLPPWLRRPLGGGEGYTRTSRAVTENRLHTVCEEARCPNRGECWSAGTATFMILGDLCTRRCGFCSVKGGRPRGELDRDEAERLARAIEMMGLKYVVITSVDRDDLADKGAAHFAECMMAIRRRVPGIEIELLTPDFRGKAAQALETLLPHAPFVWGHNVETVPRLYRSVRPGSIYQDSLALLRHAASHPGIIAKSSLMLGLGERREEILAVMDDLREAGVERITIGQYLRPTPQNLDVVEYIHPTIFDELAHEAWARGFKWVVSAPFARSSYHAELREAGPPENPAANPEAKKASAA